MEKQDILKVVRANEGTVLSFPDRGPWGNNRYRGNCSGYIHAFLIDQYNVNYMAEMYAGGGTGYDVCKDMQVKYVGADINPVPVRPDIYVCNALVDEIPEEFSEADFVFQHIPGIFLFLFTIYHNTIETIFDDERRITLYHHVSIKK